MQAGGQSIRRRGRRRQPSSARSRASPDAPVSLASASPGSVYSAGVTRQPQSARTCAALPVRRRNDRDGVKDPGRLARRNESWLGGQLSGEGAGPAGCPTCSRRTLRRNLRPTAWVRPTRDRRHVPPPPGACRCRVDNRDFPRFPADAGMWAAVAHGRARATGSDADRERGKL